MHPKTVRENCNSNTFEPIADVGFRLTILQFILMTVKQQVNTGSGQSRYFLTLVKI